MKATVSVRVPGKVMLCGEYSVLHGGRALAASLDRHLAVRVRPKTGLGGIFVASDLWDQPRFVTSSDPMTGDPLMDAVQHAMGLFHVSGLEVRIDSELDVQWGLGSSSALRLGVLMAFDELARFARGEPAVRGRSELLPLAKEAFLLQKKAQRQASGYDVATQLVGGLVDFAQNGHDDSWPVSLTVCDERAQNHLSQLIHVFGGGRGAPTAPVLQSTLSWLEDQGTVGQLDRANETLRQAFLAALADPADQTAMTDLCRATQEQRQFFIGAPGYPSTVATRLAELPGCDHDWTFKTTGAGGEDALLLLGPGAKLRDAETVLRDLGWHRIAVGFERAGARVTRGAMPHA